MLTQNWIASSLNVWLRPRLPLGLPCHFITGSSQMSSEPRALRASSYVFQLVVRYFCGAGLILLRLPDLRLLRWPSLIYATKPIQWLIKVVHTPEADGRMITLIRGVSVAASVDLTPRLRLVPLSDLPDSPQ